MTVAYELPGYPVQRMGIFASNNNDACYIVAVFAYTRCSSSFVPLSELVSAAVNSTPILYTIGTVCVTVCEPMTDYTFTLFSFFFQRQHQVEGPKGLQRPR